MNKPHTIAHPRNNPLIWQPRTLWKPQSRRAQHGFTLVEIMVAMVIGLLMMAGIMQISAANKESSRLQRNMGFVQENIRVAMDLLSRDIRMAGHAIPNPNLPAKPAPFVAVVAPTTITAAAVTADGGGADNDQLTLSYESNTDCLGVNTPVIGGRRSAVNHYFIINRRLMCRGNGIGNVAPQPLAEGVESLQILYGENTDNDPQSANRYVRADQVGTMRNVVSVRVAMRFISREAVRESADTNQYALLDAAAFTPAPNDRGLRREITTTISLRNQ